MRVESGTQRLGSRPGALHCRLRPWSPPWPAEYVYPVLRSTDGDPACGASGAVLDRFRGGGPVTVRHGLAQDGQAVGSIPESPLAYPTRAGNLLGAFSR